MDFISLLGNTPSDVSQKSDRSTIFGLYVTDVIIITSVVILFGYAYNYLIK
jgi:hypothetical protein